jgi:hypothetical protein
MNGGDGTAPTVVKYVPTHVTSGGQEPLNCYPDEIGQNDR